jgi:hypothetical protein
MNHLGEEEIAELLVERKQPPADTLTCEECVADWNQTQRRLEDVRDDIAAAAERDEIFWARQRAAIRQRLRPTGIGIRLQWAASLATLVAVGALLVGSGPKSPQHANQSNPSDPDYVLLAQIQQTLARPVPSAVEPMRLLASDMDQAYRAHLQQARTLKRDALRR